MPRRTAVVLMSTLFVLGSQGAVLAQEALPDEPMWPVATKQGATFVTDYSGGFIAVGGTDKPVGSKVWSSEDGSSWSRQEGGDAFKGAVMLRAEAFGEGVVALGQEGRRLVGWYSPDGTDWFRSSIDKVGKELQLFPFGLTVGPDGLLAVAIIIGQDIAGQRFYHSPDGQEWNIVEPPTPDPATFFTSLEGSTDEFLALGQPMGDEAGDLYWHAPVDMGWQPFEPPADGRIYDIAIGEDGSYVAVGSLVEDDTLRPAIWHATELGSWDLVHSYPSAKETEDRLNSVHVGGPGYVAAGTISGCPEQAERYCPEASLLASEDGLTWESLGIADGVPGPLHDAEVNAVASDGTTTVVLAWHEDRPSELWTLVGSQ